MHAESAESTVGVWTFLTAIDWQEPWLWGLIGFHIVCALLTAVFITFSFHNLQIALFLTLLGFVYMSEYINEWAAHNYKVFSQRQYFDSNGMFISLLFSAPLLLHCLLIIVTWMYTSVQTMIKVKRAKIREEIKKIKEKDQ